jgi:hypothetical protein
VRVTPYPSPADYPDHFSAEGMGRVGYLDAIGPITKTVCIV